MNNEKKIIRKQKWIVEHITYLDGTTELTRTNDGFGALELIGLIEISKDDIINQIRGKVKPDIVNRKFVETEEVNE
jgi:hypothetical protein